jgi:hypothetical protein
MPLAVVLSHETELRGRDGRRQLSQESDDGTKTTPAFHQEAEGCRFSADSFCRKTLVRASRIRRSDKDFHVPEPCGLRRPGHRLGDREPFVAKDPQVLELHQGPAPGNGLGGDRGFVPTAELGKVAESRL